MLYRFTRRYLPAVPKIPHLTQTFNGQYTVTLKVAILMQTGPKKKSGCLVKANNSSLSINIFFPTFAADMLVELVAMTENENRIFCFRSAVMADLNTLVGDVGADLSVIMIITISIFRHVVAYLGR